MTRDLPDLPLWHPEGWSEYDSLDELLEAIHRRVWPRDEWLDVEDCPRLHLDPYISYGEALGALRRMRREARAELRRLQCGPVLIGADRPRTRRRARLHLLALWLLYRPCPCVCGAFHVRPLIGRTR